MPQHTLEFLNKILEDQQIKPANLDQLVNDQIAEDQYLEYKHGNELNDARKARRTTREYLSAFANSDGGVLIICRHP